MRQRDRTSTISVPRVYRLVGFSYRVAQSMVRALTRILEGEGGVLWVLVLLALLVSLLQSGLAGGP